jgi:hypothetical protein
MTNKVLFTLFLIMASTTVWSQTYGSIDDSTAVDNGIAGAAGWGSCVTVTCAGGDGMGSIASSPFQTSPSVDGASRDFYINGAAFTNGLWWYKVGPNDAVSHFVLDFWVYVDNSVRSAQALEFDAFQFNNGVEYMFGTQCDYASGTWDVWNMGGRQWMQTGLACSQFQPNTWYHLSWKFHRTSPDNYEHYDSLSIQQVGKNGRVNTHTHNFRLAFPSDLMPSGWTENMGVQFQMDVSGSGGAMQEWVDGVTLTTYSYC